MNHIYKAMQQRPVLVCGQTKEWLRQVSVETDDLVFRGLVLVAAGLSLDSSNPRLHQLTRTISDPEQFGQGL